MSERGIAAATSLIESAWPLGERRSQRLRRMRGRWSRRLDSNSSNRSRFVGSLAPTGTSGTRLHKLGHVEWDLGHCATARELYEEALSIARALGDPLTVAHEVRHLGDMHRDAGRVDDAEACYQEALSLYRHHEKPPALDFANAIHPLAILKEGAGLVEEARGLLEEARDLYDAAGVQVGVADCAKRLARLSSTSRPG